MICFLKFEMYFYPRKPKLVIIYCSLLYIAIFNLLIFTSILLYFYIYSHIFMNIWVYSSFLVECLSNFDIEILLTSYNELR